MSTEFSGQSLAGNFNTIIASLSVDVTAMRATPAFRDNAAQPIVDALRNVSYEFINASYTLLRLRLVRARPPGASVHCDRQTFNLRSVRLNCAGSGRA